METASHHALTRQIPITLDNQILRGLNSQERSSAVSLLAQLILEASASRQREKNDDQK